MNYKPNTIGWQPGQYVIHDADAKTAKMIMKVISVTKEGDIITKYISNEMKSKYKLKNIWINHKKLLHNPALFNIDLSMV